MFHNHKVVVVMPAYNAARTIERTYREIPLDLVDEVVVTDDASADETVDVARRLGLRTLVHERNRGYGGNQKTCYTEALRLGADVVVMLHPDYQYTPKLIPAMISLITDGPFDVVLGRWSVNYLHDVVGVLTRLRDVLVPGGRIAVAAWAPPDANPWMAVPLGAFAEAGTPINADPQRPGMFQCSEDGALARALLRAGFQSVDQERVRLSFFAQDPGEFWTMLLRDETGGPFASALAALDPSRAEAE